MKRNASWIAAVTHGCLHGTDITITGSVETDSRECGPGSLYIARVGEMADGHDFCGAAAAQGAVCAIVERRVDIELPQIVVEDATRALGLLAQAHLADLRERHRQGSEAKYPCVIGITGSAGKTTTKDLLGQILAAVGPVVYPELSFNNEVGCPLTVLRAGEETRYLVLEMGSSGPGHIRYLTDIAPLDVAVVLMVGVAHLGGFGSVEVLARSKRELVEGLRSSGVAVLNSDDHRVRAMSEAAPGTVVFFSARGGAEAQVRAVNIQMDGGGHPSFVIEEGALKTRVDVPLVGQHQVVNALAAATAAHVASGMSFESIAEAMTSAQRLSPHRMDVRSVARFGQASDLRVIDDSYNANPDSMTAGLTTARELAEGGRLVAILGDMLELGEDSPRLHADVGRIAADLGVRDLIGVGALTADLLREAEQGGVTVHHYGDYREALRVLPGIVRSGDTIFVKGSLGSEVWRIAEAMVERSSESTQDK